MAMKKGEATKAIKPSARLMTAAHPRPRRQPNAPRPTVTITDKPPMTA